MTLIQDPSASVHSPEALRDIPQQANPFTVSKEAYVVDEALLDSLESDLVANLRAAVTSDSDSVTDSFGVVTVIVPWDHDYANFGRMTETQAYDGYDNHAAMRDYEERSIWLYTVDLDQGGIDHVKRLVPAMSPEDQAATGLTGIEVIDDRLTATDPNEVLDLATLQEYHGINDISNVMNVTSNHSTGRVNSTSSLESRMNTLRSYKATFQIAVGRGVESLFAYLNTGAIKSLGYVGVQHELLLGREFHLPEPDQPGQYDEHYVAVAIPYSDENEACFTEPFTFEPTGDTRTDRRLEMRAAISGFIANEVVPVFQLVDSDRQSGDFLVARLAA